MLEAVRTGGERPESGARPHLPIEGYAGHRAGVQRLVFGAEHPALRQGRVANVRTVGGTGGPVFAADLLAKAASRRWVCVSDPSWEDDHGLFQRSVIHTSTYPY
jgi:aromatic-amino-acid transaminase